MPWKVVAASVSAFGATVAIITTAMFDLRRDHRALTKEVAELTTRVAVLEAGNTDHRPDRGPQGYLFPP